MSRLLEIFGKGISVNTADLIWHWLDAVVNNGVESSEGSPLNEIVSLMGNMELEAAEEKLQVYIFDNPECACGRLAASAIYLHQNRLDDSVEQLNSVYLRQPNNTMALYALGYCYERLGHEAQAAEFYQDCLKFKNYLHLPRQRLAAIYFKNGQLEKVIEEYAQLKKEYPDDVMSIITLGYLYLSNGRFDTAGDAFNDAILMHPDNVFGDEDAELDELVYSGNPHEAIEQIELQLQKDPERADLRMKLADVLGMMGDQSEAVTQYQQALRTCPDFLQAAIKLGIQYSKMAHFSLAGEQFSRAAEINEHILDGYIGLATSQKLAGEIHKAKQSLSLAAAINPNTTLLISEAAKLEYKAGRDGGAFENDDAENPGKILQKIIQAHNEQVAKQPTDTDLLYRFGILLLSIGRVKDAVSAFEAAVRINPTHYRAQNKLVITMFDIGQEDKALAKLAGPRNIGRDSLALHYKTALMYCDKSRFTKSVTRLEKSIENSFTDNNPSVDISVVLQNMGLLDRASVMWHNLSLTRDTVDKSYKL